MIITYDKDGNCTRCGLPGSGFVSDGVCTCGEDHPAVKPIYTVSDIINYALASEGIDSNTVVGKDSIEYHIVHGGRKIRFFIQYDDE
jgi:hypothetical protein